MESSHHRVSRLRTHASRLRSTAHARYREEREPEEPPSISFYNEREEEEEQEREGEEQERNDLTFFGKLRFSSQFRSINVEQLFLF